MHVFYEDQGRLRLRGRDLDFVKLIIHFLRTTPYENEYIDLAEHRSLKTESEKKMKKIMKVNFHRPTLKIASLKHGLASESKATHMN